MHKHENAGPAASPARAAVARAPVKPVAQSVPLTERELEQAEQLVKLFAGGRSTPHERGRMRSLEQIAHINGENLHQLLLARRQKAADKVPTCDCTARCGDDPGVQSGKSKPCSFQLESMRLGSQRAALASIVDIARALERRGFFAESSCADAETAADMAQMRAALTGSAGVAP